MRCWGRNKELKRCKNECRFIACRHHRFQWWPLLFVIIASPLSLYNDTVELFTDDAPPEISESHQELVNLIAQRKARADNAYASLLTEIDEIIEDSVLSEEHERELLTFRVIVSEIHNTMSEMVTQEMQAIESNNLVNAHEVRKELQEFKASQNSGGILRLDSLISDSSVYGSTNHDNLNRCYLRFQGYTKLTIGPISEHYALRLELAVVKFKRTGGGMSGTSRRYVVDSVINPQRYHPDSILRRSGFENR